MEVGIWEVIATAPRCAINGTYADLTESAMVRYTVVSTNPRAVQPMCNCPNSADARPCELSCRKSREYRWLEELFEWPQPKMYAQVFHRRRLSKFPTPHAVVRNQ